MLAVAEKTRACSIDVVTTGRSHSILSHSIFRHLTTYVQAHPEPRPPWKPDAVHADDQAQSVHHEPPASWEEEVTTLLQNAEPQIPPDDNDDLYN
jgi:hypothetical protein